MAKANARMTSSIAYKRPKCKEKETPEWSRLHIVEDYVVSNSVTTKLKLKEWNSFSRAIRSDNGAKFMMSKFYESKGIVHQISCVATAQQNGRIQRRHQHILIISRALMFQSQIQKSFLLVYFETFHLMRHFMVSHLILAVSKWSGAYVILLHLHHIGTNVLILHESVPFLGYKLVEKLGIKGYIVVDIATKEIAISRNVTLYDLAPPMPSPVSLTYVYDHPNQISIDSHSLFFHNLFSI
ncbi:hypothetical protein CR513_45417, partial [Mucuna pruriens]